MYVCVCSAERTGAVLCSIHQVTPICVCVCVFGRKDWCSIVFDSSGNTYMYVCVFCRKDWCSIVFDSSGNTYMYVCVCVWQKGLVQYCVRFIR